MGRGGRANGLGTRLEGDDGPAGFKGEEIKFEVDGERVGAFC